MRALSLGQTRRLSPRLFVAVALAAGCSSNSSGPSGAGGASNGGAGGSAGRSATGGNAGSSGTGGSAGGSGTGGSAGSSGTGGSAGSSNAASVVICPNAGETGNDANCVAPGDAALPQVLAFGKQGVGTVSMAIPISVNNCSNPYIAACNGKGSVTISKLALSGPNASDFSVSGSCGTLASGSFCSPKISFQPSASAGTDETAMLTVTDNGSTPSQTLKLTGTSATVKLLSSSSCPTALSPSTNYQFTQDISCPGAAFTISGTGIDVNQNGHTLTYGTASQSTQIGAYLVNGFNAVFNVHNGTIQHGSGTNSFSTGARPLSSPIGHEGTYAVGNGSRFFNLTIDYDYQYANAIDVGANFVAHDIVVDSSASGTCADVGCRDTLQSSVIYQDGARLAPSGATQVYNITQKGGAQGGIKLDAPGALVAYTYLNPGSATGTNTNNFAIWAWGTDAVVRNNLIAFPLTSSSGTRGIQVSDAQNIGGSGRDVFDNYIGAYSLANDAEYGGCSLGGTYGVQFDDNPTGSNTAKGNSVVATASAAGCPATGLRVTDSESAQNVSHNNTFTATRQAGAPACTQGTWSEARPGCAYGLGIDGPTAFTSTNDHFIADSGCYFASADGGTGVVIRSSTCSKGSNPSGFHTIVAQNGPSNPVVVHLVDTTFEAGTSPTDTSIPAQGANVGPVSFYIEWTQTVTVTKSGGGAAAGATVKFSDALGHAHACTTDGTGKCSMAVTQERDNNDSGANQVENRNPYTLSVSLAGCATHTQTGLSITGAATRSVTLSGC